MLVKRAKEPIFVVESGGFPPLCREHMYKHFVRPVMFLFPPEFIHNLIVAKIRFFCRIPGFPGLLRLGFSDEKGGLEREICGLKFAHPVGLAAGFDKNATFYNEFSNLGFSFIEIGTVTPKPQPGNSKPRSFRLPADQALINRMGFNNLGAESAAIRLAKFRRKGLIIGGNIGKNSEIGRAHV